MIKLTLKFNEYDSALQSNSISIQFPLVRDETVYGGYATQYRYKYYYSPIYCETAGQSDYAYCNSDDWQSDSDWIEIKPIISGDKGEFDFTIPSLSCDALFKIEVQVYEDGTKSYHSSTANSTTPYFIGFYNRDTEVIFQAIERHSVNEKEFIKVKGELNKIGFCKPANYEQDLDGATWKNYCSAMLQQFIDIGSSNTLFQINCQLSLSNNWKDVVLANVLTINSNDLSEWRPHEFALDIPVEAGYAKFSSQGNVFARLDYKISIAEEATEFKFYRDGRSYITSPLLLPAAVSSFQIKRRGIKVHMLEEDPTLGTFSTGAGMFNHGEEVGVDVSGETPTHNSDLGHSIALYDTRADGATASNKPSIGFMSDKHETMASLTYDSSTGGLVSSVPVYWEGGGGGGGGGSSFPKNEIELVAYFPNGNSKTFLITSNFTFVEKQ